MAKLEILMLGPFQALLNGAPVTAFKTVKERALLAYLAAEANRPNDRAALAGLLWPDWPQQSAMHNLRHTLASLRKVIGDRNALPPYLLISRENLQLNRKSDVWVDIGKLEAANQQSSILNLQSAIHCASRVVFPYPAGVASRVRPTSRAWSRRANRRSRRTHCDRSAGIYSLVSRMGRAEGMILL